MTLRDDLIADLRRDEGEKFVVYDDATGLALVPGMVLRGNPTISMGVNLAVPITADQSLALYGPRVDQAINEATLSWPWFGPAPAAVKLGVLNMLFNLGMARLMDFHLMLGALEQGRYLEASNEALNSEWARQVGDRATRIAELFRMGQQGLGGSDGKSA